MTIKKGLDKRLDPEVAEYIKSVRSRPPAHGLPVEKLRKDLDRLSVIYPPEEVAQTRDFSIPGPSCEIPVRLYRPSGKGPFPKVVFYHGGGWAIGSIEGYSNLCSAIANNVPALVFVPGYRLAPENPFPAAVEDCYAALKYAEKYDDDFCMKSSGITVMGDSAGGNLAAVMSLKSKRESGPKISLQVLIYPATNLSRLSLPSYRRFGKDYDLDNEMIKKYRAIYLPRRKDWKDPYASPGLADDLGGMPDTIILTSEFDPLRDDGAEFASRLRKSGVKVDYIMYKGVIHGFMSFTGFAIAQKAIKELAKNIARRAYSV